VVALPDAVVPSTGELVALGRANGLDAVGVCTARPFTETRVALESRKAAGLHGGMAFTYRRPERSTDPSITVPRAAALVVGAAGYHRAEPPRPRDHGPVARVAAYAWEDHYGRVRQGLTPISERLRAEGWRARVVVDDNALVDRAAAVRAGLGWWGKSANVLVPGRGSWFVLGAVITDAPLVTADPEPVADGCATCRRCLDGCPTGAIVAPGVVDARRCLSWLLQAPGPFPRALRAALGDRLYGCDDCQEVCPPNRRDDRAGRRAAGDDAQAWVPVLGLLDADDREILARHGRWYIAGRDPRWVRRNALVVLGNVGDGGDPAVVAALGRFLAHPDPTLRAHAVWAAARLGRHDLLAPLAGDPDPEVRAELSACAARGAREGA
jgi:epoxyqueuosine reductase